MVSHHLDLRDISIPMDLSNLHRNSDRPGFYSGWICVSDCCLPLKGTAHRAVKDKDALKPTEINTFVSSDLWRLQGLATDFPLALSEQEFHVPSVRGHLSGNDARRNLTDSQETSQWIAGESFAIKTLEALLGALLDNKNFYLVQLFHCWGSLPKNLILHVVNVRFVTQVSLVENE